MSAALRTLQLGMTAAAVAGGGVDRYYFSLLRAFPEVAVQADGLVVGDASAANEAPGVRCYAPGEAGMLVRWRGLRAAVPPLLPRTDVVVSHFSPVAFPVLDLIRRKPFVVHFHGPWALESAVEGAGRANVLAKRTLERIVYARGSRFIVLSQAFGKILEREYGVAARRIRIVPGGVDLARFDRLASREEARRALDLPTDRPIVLTVRRLVRAKGLENLIDAVDEIRRRIPDVLVVIVGTGPLAANLRARAEARGVGDRVRFAGFVAEADLPKAYRAADLMVVPTIALEGFGLVVVEALACGTPVLVTPIAGLPEVVRDLDPALILGGADAASLASGVAGALAGELPLPDADACAAYARRFDWRSIAQRVRDVYTEA